MAENYKTDFTTSYQAAAAADVVVKSTPGFLHAIIVGKDVASSSIDISDHATSGSTNVKVHIEGSTLKGVYPINANFDKGITATLTNQTNVTFIYK